VKPIKWNTDKNKILIQGRNISFSVVSQLIINGKTIAIIKHPNYKKYPNQQVFIINIENYIYLIPFVEDDKKIFLKTIIPSRKATRDYLKIKSKK